MKILAYVFVLFFLYNSYYYGFTHAWIHYDQLSQTIFPSELIISNSGIPLPIKPLSDIQTKVPFIENLGLFYPPFNYLANVYFYIFDNKNYEILARSILLPVCFSIIGLFYSHARFNKKYSWPITLIVLTSFQPFILFSSVFQGEILILLFTILFIFTFEKANKEISFTNAIIAGLAISFGCLSKQWMIAIYPIILIHLYINKFQRNIIFTSLIFAAPGLFYTVYSQLAIASPKIPISSDLIPQVLSLIKFAFEFPIQTNFNYDLEGWGPIVLIFGLVGLSQSVKNKSLLLQNSNLIAFSALILYLFLYFLMPVHVTPLFFAGYLIVAAPALVFLSVDGYIHSTKLCVKKSSRLLLNILFISMALYSFGYSFLGGGNNFTYCAKYFKDFGHKSYTRLETIGLIHPDEYEYLKFINQLKLNNEQRILSASNFELATIGINLALTPARYEIIELRYISNQEDLNKYLQSKKIKYLLITKGNEYIWRDLESKFDGYNLLKKIQNEKLKIIFENKIAKIYELN